MSQAPNMPPFNQPQPGNPQPPPGPVPAPQARWRFRTAWVLVPAACLTAAGLLQLVGVPVFDWVDVMKLVTVPVKSFGRFTGLAVLGLVLIAVTVGIRIYRSGKQRP